MHCLYMYLNIFNHCIQVYNANWKSTHHLKYLIPSNFPSCFPSGDDKTNIYHHNKELPVYSIYKFPHWEIQIILTAKGKRDRDLVTCFHCYKSTHLLYPAPPRGRRHYGPAGAPQTWRRPDSVSHQLEKTSPHPPNLYPLGSGERRASFLMSVMWESWKNKMGSITSL